MVFLIAEFIMSCETSCTNFLFVLQFRHEALSFSPQEKKMPPSNWNIPKFVKDFLDERRSCDQNPDLVNAENLSERKSLAKKFDAYFFKIYTVS